MSLAALLFRAHDLGLISERHYRTLFMELNKLPNGWEREPGVFPREEPQLVRRVIDSYGAHGYSVGDLCKMMVLTESKFRLRYRGEILPGGRLRLVKGAADEAAGWRLLASRGTPLRARVLSRGSR